jgi:hypothetical protein
MTYIYICHSRKNSDYIQIHVLHRAWHISIWAKPRSCIPQEILPKNIVYMTSITENGLTLANSDMKIIQNIVIKKEDEII